MLVTRLKLHVNRVFRPLFQIPASSIGLSYILSDLQLRWQTEAPHAIVCVVTSRNMTRPLTATLPLDTYLKRLERTQGSYSQSDALENMRIPATVILALKCSD